MRKLFVILFACFTFLLVSCSGEPTDDSELFAETFATNDTASISIAESDYREQIETDPFLQMEINQRIDEQRRAILEESSEEKGIPFDEDSDLTNEQREQIEELQKEALRMQQEGIIMGGIFWRQERIIIGEIDSDTPRLDLDTVKAIISKNDSLSDILDEFIKIHKYPDLIHGSGISTYEFWFDEKGDKKILARVEIGEVLFESSGRYVSIFPIFPSDEELEAFIKNIEND